MVRNYKRKTIDRWSKEDLLKALISIKETTLKINEAARLFGISRATLYRQYGKFRESGGICDVNQFRTCGGNPILTRIEEDVLEKTILDLRDQGFSVTSSDIKRICYEYCDSNGIQNQFNTEKRMASDDWYYGFLKRHPNVKVTKSITDADGNSRSIEYNPEDSSSNDGQMEVNLKLSEVEAAPGVIEVQMIQQESPKIKRSGRIIKKKLKRLNANKVKSVTSTKSKQAKVKGIKRRKKKVEIVKEELEEEVEEEEEEVEEEEEEDDDMEEEGGLPEESATVVSAEILSSPPEEVGTEYPQEIAVLQQSPTETYLITAVVTQPVSEDSVSDLPPPFEDSSLEPPNLLPADSPQESATEHPPDLSPAESPAGSPSDLLL